MVIALAIFVDGVLQCFQVKKNDFCGDNALFAGSFDSLLNLEDAFIMLTSTRFNTALIFFLFVAGYLHVYIDLIRHIDDLYLSKY